MPISIRRDVTSSADHPPRIITCVCFAKPSSLGVTEPFLTQKTACLSRFLHKISRPSTWSGAAARGSVLVPRRADRQAVPRPARHIVERVVDHRRDDRRDRAPSLARIRAPGNATRAQDIFSIGIHTSESFVRQIRLHFQYRSLVNSKYMQSSVSSGRVPRAGARSHRSG